MPEPTFSPHCETCRWLQTQASLGRPSILAQFHFHPSPVVQNSSLEQESIQKE